MSGEIPDDPGPLRAEPPLPPPPVLCNEEQRWAIPAGDGVEIRDSASGPSPTSFTAATENLFQKQFGEMCFTWHGVNGR